MYMCSCQLHNLSTEYTALLPLPLLSTLNNSRNLLHLQKFWLHQKFPITAKDKDFWPFDPIRTVSVISQLPDFFGSWNSSSTRFICPSRTLLACSSQKPKTFPPHNLLQVLTTPVAQWLGSIQASEHLFSPTHSVSPFTNFIFQHFNLYISLCGMHL